MFGETIADPHAIESASGVQPGLGLLAGATVLACEKVLRLTTARHTPSGLSIKGYEIHHGHTAAPGSRVAFVREDGEAVGFFSENGRVVGTYLHGVFDDDAFRRWFVDDLRCRRGLTPLVHIQAFFNIEPALDRLADIVRAHLDVGRIYRKMGLK
jgi:cobyric acid synthase